MKLKKYWLVILFSVTVPIKLLGQEVRLNNSFIILINDKLPSYVSSLKFISVNYNGKEDSIDGGYYPGVLYLSNEQERNILYADSLKKLTLKFDHYEYFGKRQMLSNYSIDIDRRWLKQPYIIVKISDFNKKKGLYKYTFEVSGITFGTVN